MRFYINTIIFTTITLLFFQTPLQSQETSISGQINQYASVQYIDYCQSYLLTSNAAAFTIGTDAILIQMQGATIDENGDRFGTITVMNGAGLYEKCTIKAITEDTIFLNNSLLNTYEIEGVVQLVSMPGFVDANVTETLLAQNWDGTTGGVIALKVENTLSLNAPIDANGSGFRGGETISPENRCTGGFNSASSFFYERGDWRGAAKGEGIALMISGKEHGKGPQANGGGGGNDHNSGGGGGSHTSLGGNGGRRLTPFIDPSLRCKGDNPGLKGKDLRRIENRLFLGGGGGAGHTNNSENIGGGNGGGIIIIEAGTLNGNGRLITASGATALDARGDGGSGGGAAGSIVFLINEVSSEVNILLAGGDGGDANNANSSSCMGPGGGGSGGRLLTNANASQPINFSLLGGNAGRSINSTDSDCQNVRNNAEDGEDGLLELIRNINQSSVSIAPPSILNQSTDVVTCAGVNANINIEVEGNELSYQWQIDRGNGAGFENVVESDTFVGTNLETLIINDVTADLNGTQFRLLISSSCFDDLISEPINFIIESQAVVADFDFDLQAGGVVVFTNTSEFADEILWDFGNGILSSMNNTSFTFPEEGAYEVTLTATNDCGSTSITKTINVVFGPSAGFTTRVFEGCAPLEIDFQNLSSENAETFEWLFIGGTPSTSTERTPTITYNEAGVYEVTLIAFNELGSDTLTRRGFINIEAAPNPNFIEESQNNDLTIELTNTTIGADSYVWDFGDGSPTSTASDPTHTYSESGNYQVTLTATNGCGSNTIVIEIAVGSAPLALFSSNTTAACFPVTIQFLDQSSGQVDGWNWSFPGGQPNQSSEQNPRVTYTEPGKFGVNLMVNNELGSDEVQRDSFIQISASPSPNFNFTVNEAGVDFINLSSNADSYIWSFGDGNTSMNENPMHEYDRTGLYYVTLNAYNDACASSSTKAVNIVLSSIDNIAEKIIVKSYPNPVSDFLTIALENLIPTQLELRLMDINGKILQTKQMNATQLIQLEMTNYPAGYYYVQILGGKWQVTEQVMKK